MTCRTGLCTAGEEKKGMHMHNTHVEQLSVPLKKYVYVCSTGGDNSTALSCVGWRVCVCMCVCVCVWGGGGRGSVFSTLIGSPQNLMYTIRKKPSAVIARTMGWNCSIVSVSHLSQSQSVGHTNTSPPERWGGGGGVGGGGALRGGAFRCFVFLSTPN